ncbi:MAG TPA: dihydrolipoamide acetyltransferase family protein [Solirubrobacterales bacterium]|jgi:pyruvate dehydrogenase E2 component (dihydrolipoamide acetyltransferase)|nr:dihydrolipoamide acetyltransferase family protein [Solirubrobacterales bacterium]
MAEIVMPRLSDSMEEGTVLRWLKGVGDEVSVGDELVEIETDKANMVYESDLDGTIVEVLAQEGDTLPVGEPIAKVGDASEVVTTGNGGAPREEPAERAPEPPKEESPAPAVTAAPPAPASAGGDGRVKASPIAKRIARDRGLDLSALTGSGPGGRIVKADVERALDSGAAAPAAPAASPAPAAPAAPAAAPAGPTPGVSEKPETAKGQVEVVELTKLQQTVARRMAESKATAPHFYLQAEIDMTSAVDGRAKLKASAREGEVVPTFNDMVVKACALALREYPRANGAYRDGKIELYSRINVGVAVAAQDALVVPTVFDADQKGLRRIAAETRALAARVRDGSITPPELSGGTFTVSNLGMYGISNFSAVINTPQAGILAVGEVKAKPVVSDSGEIEARRLMGVTLACDHRILYGADGAEFLARVRELLEEPLGLAL